MRLEFHPSTVGDVNEAASHYGRARAGLDAEVIAAVVARLGIADVRAFGLTWTDCEELLAKLGFSARVEIVAEA